MFHEVPSVHGNLIKYLLDEAKTCLSCEANGTYDKKKFVYRHFTLTSIGIKAIKLPKEMSTG